MEEVESRYFAIRAWWLSSGATFPPPGSLVEAAALLPILNIQLDNACFDNKNEYVFNIFCLLVHKGVFSEVYINFLLVGHIHEYIDIMFGRGSYRLRKNDYPILPMLIKLFMDVERKLIIPHLIEEIPNFKTFFDGYLCSGNNALHRHTNTQQFKFYKDDNDWPLMQYKLWYTDSNWLPKENGGIRLWQKIADGRPKVSSRFLVLLGLQRMKNFDEFTKGLNGFVNLSNTMANKDISSEFRRQNEPLCYYQIGGRATIGLNRRAVRSTMALDIFGLRDLTWQVLAFFQVWSGCGE